MNGINKILTILIILLTVSSASGQHKKQVLLSEKVGLVIDKAEKTKYQLFYKIKGFTEAVIYSDSTGNYYSIIQSENDSKVKKDTMIYYKEEDIIKLAEQIQFFDEIQNGSHSFGEVTASIITKNDIVYIVLKEDISKRITKTSQDNKTSFHFYEFPKSNQRNKKNYPDFGFGYSMSYSNIDFSPVTNYVNNVENYLISKGFDVKKSNLNLDNYPVSTLSTFIRLYKDFGLSAEIGLRNIGGFSDFRYFSIYLQYHFRLRNSDWLQPHLALGVKSLRYTISFHYHDYNAEQTEYLEEIKSEGESLGFLIKAGTEVRMIEFSEASSFVFDVFCKYAFIREQESAEYYGYKTKLNLSNISAGAGIKIYF